MLKIGKKLSILVLMLIISVASCFTGCNNSTIVNDENTLYVWTGGLVANYKSILDVNPNDGEALFTKYVINTFEEANPGKHVMLQANGWGQDLNKNIVSALNSGGSVAVDVVPGEEYLKRFIDGGAFAELNLPESLMNNIYPSLKAKGIRESDGKVFAVPTGTGSFALYVNKEVLKDLGILNEKYEVKEAYEDLNPLAPKTWEDLLALCQEVKSLFDAKYKNDSKKAANYGGIAISGTKEGSAWRALPIIRTAGGDLADADGAPSFNTPENKVAFQMLQDLSKTAPRGITGVSQENSVMEYFMQNQVAYMVESTSILDLCKGKPCEGKFDVCEIPVFEDKNIKSNAAVGNVYYSIWGRSTKKDLALKFIEHMMSEDIQKAQIKYTFRLSALNSVMNSEEIKTDEYQYDFALKTFYKPFTDTLYENVDLLPGFQNNAAQIWEQWQDFITKVCGNGNPITDNYLQSIQTNMTNAYNRK